jgi:hypothetical protein
VPDVTGTPVAGISAVAADGNNDIGFADVSDFIHYACVVPS